MENELDFVEMKNESMVVYGKASATAQCNIDSTAKGGVKKLLSVTSSVASSIVERAGDMVKVIATLNCKVIFINHDGVMDSYDYLSEFSTMVEGDIAAIDSSKAMWAMCNVLDVDSSVRGDIISVQSVIGIEVICVSAVSCSCVAKVCDDILVKTESVPCQLATIMRDTFSIDEDYESGSDIEKILFFDSSAIITGAKADEGKAIVSGTLCSTVVYIADGAPCSKVFNIPFAQDISQAGMCECDKLALSVRVSDSKIVISGVEGDNVLCLQFELVCDGICFITESKTVILDMHCPNNKIDMEYCECQYNEYLGQSAMSDKIIGSAELAEDMCPAHKILATTISRQVVANTYVESGMIMVEGLLACNVMYEDTDGECSSIMVELPYSLQFDGSTYDESAKYICDSMIEQLYAKIKRDREIEVTAMISIYMLCDKPMNNKCVSSYTRGEEMVGVDYAMSIYHSCAGESLWDIAKAMNAPMHKLACQNPSLGDCSTGQNVVYYRQLNSCK